MNSSKVASEWAVDNPAMARGRLLTSAQRLAAATAMVNRLVGYVDAADKFVHMDAPKDRQTGASLAFEFEDTLDETRRGLTEYLELGMDEIQRELLHAVHALDLGDGAEPVPLSPYAATDERAKPVGRPFETVTQVARNVLTAEVTRLRTGAGGWGGGSPEAQQLAAAIEVLLDSTIVGRKR